MRICVCIYIYTWHICWPGTHHCMYLLYDIFCDDVAPSTASPGSFRWLLRISAKSFRKLHQLSSESLLLKPITPQSNNLTGFFGRIETYKSLPITRNQSGEVIITHKPKNFRNFGGVIPIQFSSFQ